MEKKPSGIRCNILQGKNFPNCSLGGISEKFNEVTLILPEGGPFEPSEDAPAVVLVYRNLRSVGGPAEYVHAEPADKGNRWAMAGGQFIWDSDSRFPSNYPISLHDRFE